MRSNLFSRLTVFLGVVALGACSEATSNPTGDSSGHSTQQGVQCDDGGCDTDLNCDDDDDDCDSDDGTAVEPMCTADRPADFEADHNCHVVDGNVVIEQASDLTQYAGYSCLSIHGDLLVQDTSGLDDLAELSGLRYVSGEIVVSETHDLMSLAGLQHVQYVGSDLVVEGNDSLTDAAMPELAYVERNFHVFDNPVMTDLDVASLTSVGAQFIIDTSAMAELDFPSLRYTADDFIIEHMEQLRRVDLPVWTRHEGLVLVEVNNQLVEFNAPNLGSIESTLTFRLNDALTDIDLSGLEYIGSRPSFIGNVSLSTCEIQDIINTVGIYDIGAKPYAADNGPQTCQLDFSQTEVCRIIDGDVVIHDQEDVQDFRQQAGTGCVSIRGSLFVRDTDALTDLSAFSGLRFVSNWVSIADNQSLTSLDALANLRFIGYGLVVEGNGRLQSMDLPSLDVIGTVLQVFGNASLATIGLPALDVVGDQLVIEANDSLQWADLSALVWLGAQFDLENNDQLAWINLQDLTHIIGSVRVRYNQQLEVLNMASLIHIGQSFRVIHNIALRCLVFPYLEFVAADIQIDYNPLVDNCTVFGLIGQIDPYDVGGRIRVFNRDPGSCPNYQQGQSGSIGQTPDFDDHDDENNDNDSD